MRDKTGISAASGYGLITHLYNLRNGLVPRDAVSLCTVADYLGMVLTGRKYPLVHVSNAASLGFFDVRKGAFHIEAMKEMEIELSILPEITEEHRDVCVLLKLSYALSALMSLWRSIGEMHVTGTSAMASSVPNARRRL